MASSKAQKITDLTNDINVNKQNLINLILAHKERFDSYIWTDTRPNSHQHLSQKLIQILDYLSNYQVNPDNIERIQAGRDLENLKIDRMNCLNQHLCNSLLAFADETVKTSNDSLLNSVIYCIHGFVMWSDFIPQD